MLHPAFLHGLMDDACLLTLLHINWLKTWSGALMFFALMYSWPLYDDYTYGFIA
jgi:hypothetical protein